VNYRTLEHDKIADTAHRLEMRILERFPDSNLGQVAVNFTTIAREAHDRGREIRKPYIFLRIVTFTLLAASLVALVSLFRAVQMTEGVWQIENFLESFNAALGSLVFIGGAILFLVTYETRLRRRKALLAINELRALAHIIDMHQLTKDPEQLLRQGPSTPSSPKRVMSPFELSRYFDYCSEMLSLITKVGALYVQSFPDRVALDAIDVVESLCTGLSRKIWQKIMILDRYASDGAEGGTKEKVAGTFSTRT